MIDGPCFVASRYWYESGRCPPLRLGLEGEPRQRWQPVGERFGGRHRDGVPGLAADVLDRQRLRHPLLEESVMRLAFLTVRVVGEVRRSG